MIVGGIAARIEAARHHPVPGCSDCSGPAQPATGWSATAYDIVRIGGWALLVFGAVIVVFALVREFRRSA
jgi:hypothetical protein